MQVDTNTENETKDNNNNENWEWKKNVVHWIVHSTLTATISA